MQDEYMGTFTMDCVLSGGPGSFTIPWNYWVDF